MARSFAVCCLLAIAAPVHAEGEDLVGSTVIFVRGTSVIRTDAKGKGETEIATLAAKTTVRALRTDATGSVLLADLAGKWSWMRLDGSTTTLTELPCADGPAQLATDGACVLCRDAKQPTGSIIVNLRTGKTTPIAVPAPGARLAGAGKDRKLVWADPAGVWAAPPGDPAKKTQVAPQPPLRHLLPSPDGSRAVGVYSDFVYEGRQQKPAELLMGFALDGQGARRKGIRNGVPVDWSFDNQWVLVQDGSAACLMRAIGGEYKCWRGYTAVSIAPDGAYALILGNRDGSKKQTPKKASPKKKDAEPEGEPVTEAEGAAPIDDVAVAPPTGPLALYRAQLAGAYTVAASRIVQVVDGAAVWIPKP
jgi:hypothetical protein